MPPLPRQTSAVTRELQTKLASAITSVEVVDRAAEVLLPRVPASVWCGVVLDPATLLDTGGQHQQGFPAEVMPRLFEIEHAEQDDVDSLRSLARRHATASLLSRSTAGQLEVSKYYRQILRPLSLADELRVVLRDAGTVWGLLVLCRDEGAAPFTDDDLRVAEQVAGPATDALRRSLLLNGTDPAGVADATGFVLLNKDHSIADLSPSARGLLADLAEEHEPGRTPHSVSALASHAQAAAGGGVSRSRARTRSGSWVTLHAWRSATDDGRTTISVAPAHPGDLSPLILDAYPFTARERQIVQHVLLGRSTGEIASALKVSRLTVQDHLKAVFAKTGVRSRRDLVADVFFQHYAPRLAQPPLTTDGRLHDAASGTAAAAV